MMEPRSTLALLTLFAVAVSGSRLGEKCEYDSDCDVAFSFCRGQQVCECKRGFEQGPTTDRCVATIGAHCTTHYDCAGLPNSECAMNVCSCRENFVAHSSARECLMVAPIYMATCVEHGQCISAFGDRMECRESKCQCIPMHHFTDNVCIQSKALDEPCMSSKECYVSEDDEMNKKVACTAGRCQCIMGFHMALDHKTCTDGAGQLGAISLCASLVLSMTLLFFK
ncbi:protein delta homolog 2-like [Neocloeon triangulifer]|uniref:protein delta homolog 2-like n=1 Tax=Neocloeon triangulifer TaxID=2078957 RepID=UPI00286F2FE9|nr:protein delta homolog 2-like [Neocloeon triangulifer]